MVRSGDRPRWPWAVLVCLITPLLPVSLFRMRGLAQLRVFPRRQVVSSLVCSVVSGCLPPFHVVMPTVNTVGVSLGPARAGGRSTVSVVDENLEPGRLGGSRGH